MEKKLKHLEFIQNTISRMASNLFMLKGWSITLIAALFGLAAKDANQKYIVVAYFLVVIFWILDGYFLSQERMYRDLYKEVSLKDENQIDFLMDASKFNEGKNTWIASVISKTIAGFYLSLAVTMTITTYFLN